MGEYAIYIWPAFAISALVLGAVSLISMRALQKAQATMARIQKDSGSHET
jgi:heme exporter protein CcmD